jgi:ADP-ribose pyrophosphatase
MERNPWGEVLWRGRVFDFVREEVTLPNGKATVAEGLRHPGSCAVVPVLDDGSLFLIREYRPSIRKFIWEIPAGTLHPGEDPLDCARRELAEECGHRAERFEKLGEIYIAPGYSDERIYLYLARGLTSCPQQLDEDELLTVHPFTADRVRAMLRANEIEDATTIVGLGMAFSTWCE